MKLWKIFEFGFALILSRILVHIVPNVQPDRLDTFRLYYSEIIN